MAKDLVRNDGLAVMLRGLERPCSPAGRREQHERSIFASGSLAWARLRGCGDVKAKELFEADLPQARIRAYR